MTKIVTERTESPFRESQWCAYDGDTYCGCPDCHCTVGLGPTREAAIVDYYSILAEDADPIRCVHCGSTGEHVEMMALVAGVGDPICCDDAAWQAVKK